MPKLSILIATVGEREERFRYLAESLAPQVNKHGGAVEVLVYWNNFERPIAEIRQALVDEARGDYVCFIDDDDEVPAYYCDRIIEATKSDPDYVGWQMQLFWDGKKMKPTYHSISFGGWSEDKHGYYRDISHLNPIKREIARKVPFSPPKNQPEDVSWARMVAPLVLTEEYIDQPMYFYHYNSFDSVWRGKPAPEDDYIRPDINAYGEHFRYHPESKPWYLAPRDVAVIAIDVWDRHWHEPTQELLDNGFAVEINDFVCAMRSGGALIIHAPTSVTDRHRRRPMPLLDEFQDEIPSPANIFYNGEEIGGVSTPPWTRQHPDLKIHPDDYVSDDASEIMSLLRATGVQVVYLVGMHTDLCIVHNSFAAYNLRRYGFNPVIIEDLTVPMCVEQDEMVRMLHEAGFKTLPSDCAFEGEDNGQG